MRSAAAVRWLLLLLAWTHLAYAAHQFAHAPDERGASCAVCVHLDRVDETPPSQAADVCTAAYPNERVSCAVAAFSPRANVPYQARASP